MRRLLPLLLLLLLLLILAALMLIWAILFVAPAAPAAADRDSRFCSFFSSFQFIVAADGRVRWGRHGHQVRLLRHPVRLDGQQLQRLQVHQDLCC